MKTKIIYISGNEIFDMADIRAAFEEVRKALNLDKDTVLFGVPVDSEDTGFATKTDTQIKDTVEKIPESVNNEPEEVISATIIQTEIVHEPQDENKNEEEIESVVEDHPVKKRGRPRKETVVMEEPVSVIEEEPIEETTEETPDKEERVVPILSVLATNDKDDIVEDSEIIPEISDEVIEEPTDESEENHQVDNDADLEKLLSAMTPLDISEDQEMDVIVDTPKDTEEDVSVDATLEQLATEFAEKQDKIVSETKTSARNRIGKLRNILPFKQSKHKDTGLGDLFGWAGTAANDEDFSVPGFFTNAASRK